jgi:hypothetical protein
MFLLEHGKWRSRGPVEKGQSSTVRDGDGGEIEGVEVGRAGEDDVPSRGRERPMFGSG